MTESEIISRIIELESEITQRVISDKTFRANDQDEYQEYRIELKILRKQVAHLIHPKCELPGGDPQRPRIDGWQNNNTKLKD